jgi:hypothetical protein
MTRPILKATINGVRQNGSPNLIKFRVQKSVRNFIASILWDQDGITLIGYFTKGRFINAEYYSSLLVQLKDILMEKRRPQEVDQGGPVLARQGPGPPGTYNPEETSLPAVPVS